MPETRSGWSYVANRMKKDMDYSDNEVGLLNMAFLLFLGIGFHINGHIGKRYEASD